MTEPRYHSLGIITRAQAKAAAERMLRKLRRQQPPAVTFEEPEPDKPMRLHERAVLGHPDTFPRALPPVPGTVFLERGRTQARSSPSARDGSSGGRSRP